MGRRLEGKVAVVTGSGMGAAKGIAVGLAREGARVVTNNRKPGSVGLSSWSNKETTESLLNEEDKKVIASLSGDAQTTADQIIAEGGEAIPFFGDPGHFDTAGQLIQTAVDQWGRIDILVNGASGSGFGPFLKITQEDWHLQTHAKLTGTFNTMHHALPIMNQQRSGRILNAASDAWVGLPMLSAYSAANAGVVGLTRAVAQEVSGSNITCNVFCPRSISRNHVNWRASMRGKLAGGGPEIAALRERLAKEEKDHQAPENLGPFLAYLATEEAGNINGTVFTVTAGGRIALYSGFTQVAEIQKNDAPWTVEELIVAVPERLLAGRETTAGSASGASPL
ncbi:short-chain dehydrogenase/reductase SDR [Parafrankia sp. EAN1pec]|uniref:SDR family NAD(P)-dependent oxidoreductase n=1 Tax=Parafrankia sp. (strain EAN1pec) TaxID=298653 RepID=UPI0000540F6E|nr:short-chain dehydrogenase/reductase SDR [Frankia sp. EAN1pec]